MSAAGTTKSCWKLGEFVAHSSSVNCVSLSPSNGRMLASGGDDRKVVLWMVGQASPLLKISGSTSPVQSVTFNSSENWLCAGTKSGVVKVFDLDENRLVRTISGHSAAIQCVDFHRYGDILATGSMDTHLKVWDVRRKGCIFTYRGHQDAINCIQFSPDGKWVVSSSNDNTVKLWDLGAGRLLHDFTEHTSAVTSLAFHPMELLLATGSLDRTVKFWDVERLCQVSEAPVEASGIRCVQFHPEGQCLFSGSQDFLKVYSWEPARTLHSCPVGWGKVADIAVSGEQLIGASFYQTNISLWCFDLKSMSSQPRPDAHGSSQTTSQSLSSSGRRQFEYRKEEFQRPFTQASSARPQQQDKAELKEKESKGGNSPPMTEVKPEERAKILESRQRLMRTPPKKTPPPFLPPEAAAPPPPLPLPLPPLNQPNNHHHNAPVSHQPVTSNPLDALRLEIEQGNQSVCRSFHNRLDLLKQARSEWSLADPKNALEVVINSGSQSALVDLLNILLIKRTLWSLEMALMVLPEIKFLLQSTHERFVECGCSALQLILKSFGPVIKTNTSEPPPPSGGVDIHREERFERCQHCHSHLLVLRGSVERLQKEAGVARRTVREHRLLEAFAILD